VSLDAWWLASLAANAALVACLLIRRGLARSYPLLLALAAAQLARTGYLRVATPGPESNLYYQSWLYTEPILIGLRAAAAVEACRLLASRFSRMGPWLAGIPLAAAAVASVAVWWTWGHPGMVALHGRVVAVARASWAILAVAWGLVWAWMARAIPLPPATSPAARRHATVMMGYLASQALPYLAAHVAGPSWVPGMSRVALCGAAIAQLAWCVVLQVPVAEPRLPDDPERRHELRREAARLLGVLDRRR
jgi:hypothetical protein